MNSIVDSYGMKYTKRLIKYFNNKGEIGDLHCGNYGYNLKTKKPVIFDYAGYSNVYV